MKIQVNRSTTPAEITEILKETMPQFQTELKKNPLFRFEYVQLRKSAFVGAWIRVKNGNTVTIEGAVPSAIARGLLGGLLLMTVNYFQTRKLNADIAAAIQSKLN